MPKLYQFIMNFSSMGFECFENSIDWTMFYKKILASNSWRPVKDLVFADLLAVIELCQSTFAGFTEAVIQMDAGFLHGPADHVIADISGAGEEIA